MTGVQTCLFRSIYAGTRVLYPPVGFTHYAFDHTTGGAGGIDITDDYTTSEKYNSLSTNRSTAGGSFGNDVSDVVASGPFTINVNDTQKVVFALVAGDNLNELIEVSDSAASLYNSGLVTDIKSTTQYRDNNIIIYPNPANSDQIIYFNEKIKDRTAILEIYDITGKKIETIKLDTNYNIVNTSLLPKGVYSYKISYDGYSIVKKVILVD